MTSIGRKLIIVPKDSAALRAFSYNEATDDQLLTISMSEPVFLNLWNLNFFQGINSIAGVNIDIFEDEEIFNTATLEELVSSYLFEIEFIDPEVNRVVREIKEFFLEAINRCTGVFFYF